MQLKNDSCIDFFTTEWNQNAHSDFNIPHNFCWNFVGKSSFEIKWKDNLGEIQYFAVMMGWCGDVAIWQFGNVQIWKYENMELKNLI